MPCIDAAVLTQKSVIGRTASAAPDAEIRNKLFGNKISVMTRPRKSGASCIIIYCQIANNH